MGVGQSVIFSQPRGDRGAMEDLPKDKKQFARLLFPGLLPFLLNFQCLLTPLEITGFYLILPSES